VRHRYEVKMGWHRWGYLFFGVVLAGADQPELCWYSDGWHSSGYYNCRLGPWVKPYGIETLRGKDGRDQTEGGERK